MSELLDDHLIYLQAIKRRAATIAARRAVLTAADEALPYGIDNATTDEWAWYIAQHDEWSQWTVNTYWNHWDGFYLWGTSGRDPWLRYNPLDDLPRPRQPRGAPNPVTDDELDHALAESNEWWQLVIMLCAFEGFRAGDVVSVQRSDVDKLNVRINDGKGGKSAEIPTDPDVWERVRGLPRGRHVVVGPKLGRPLSSAHYLTCKAREHFDKLGLPDVHLQRFRHWFATDLIRRGWDISVVRVLMRHESILVTQRYVFIAGELRRLAICTKPTLSERLAKRHLTQDEITLTAFAHSQVMPSWERSHVGATFAPRQAVM